MGKKLQTSKYKLQTKYKLQIKIKSSHGLHKGPIKLQTMTAFNQKFLRGGPGGAVFSKSAPPGQDSVDMYTEGN
jgi:hypothetical protein